MGNSLIFPVPKCSYSRNSLHPFFKHIAVVEEHYTGKMSVSVNREIPTLHVKAAVKSKYLLIYFHGNSDDLGRLYESMIDYYERFQVKLT